VARYLLFFQKINKEPVLQNGFLKGPAYVFCCFFLGRREQNVVENKSVPGGILMASARSVGGLPTACW